VNKELQTKMPKSNNSNISTINLVKSTSGLGSKFATLQLLC